MKDARLSPRQSAIVRLMRDDPRRDLYEGGDKTGKRGCGLYWVTYSADAKYDPLTTDEVLDLLNRRVIELRYQDCPGFYQLVQLNQPRSKR